MFSKYSHALSDITLKADNLCIYQHIKNGLYINYVISA